MFCLRRKTIDNILEKMHELVPGSNDNGGRRIPGVADYIAYIIISFPHFCHISDIHFHIISIMLVRFGIIIVVTRSLRNIDNLAIIISQG